MTSLHFPRTFTRLQSLLSAAVALAVVAMMVNVLHWRRVSARGPGSAHQAVDSAPAAPTDDRPARIMELAWHLQRHPHDVPARFRLAERYFQVRDYPRSLRELDVLQREHPDNPEVYLRRSVVLKYAGQPARAEQAVRRALALRPGYEAALEWLGQIYLGQERYHQALEFFNGWLKRRPDSYPALMGKGRALEQLLLSRHPVEISGMTGAVEKAVRLEPGNPMGLLVLARMTLAYLNRPEEAEKLALRAAQLDPQSAGPCIILTEIALKRPPTPANLQKAGEYAYQAGVRNLADPRPPYYLGRVSLLRNDVDRAVKALERSLELGPMPEAVSQLAVAHRRAGSVERANYYAGIYQGYMDLMGRRNALLSDLSREPGEVRHSYALAELYLQAKQPLQARYWLKEAQRLQRRDPRRDRLMARVKKLQAEGAHAPMLPIP